MMDWKKTYGPLVGVRLGDWRTIIINDLEWIKEAFNQEAFNGRPEFKAAMMFTGGDEHGTLTSAGDPWDTIRKFTMKNLNNFGFGRKSMEGFLQSDVSALVSNLREEAAKGMPMSFQGKFYIPATNHLWFILTGQEFPKEKVSEVHKIITNLNEALWRPIGDAIWMMPWLTSIFPKKTGLTSLESALRPFKSFVRGRIEELKRCVTLDKAPESLVDAFLQEMLKAEDDPTSHFHRGRGTNHMESMIMNLFVTAAEAINNTMNWALLYLALNPEVQEKLAQEISEVLYPNELPTLDDITRMPYTKAVMQETLRIATTSPFSNFQASTRDVEFKGYRIPKGTMVIANLYGLHHDEALWKEPERFHPERFLGDAGRKTSPLVPFSVGLRTCLGQTFSKNELFIMLVALVQNFQFQWDDESQERPTEDDLITKCRVSIFRFCPKYKLVCKERKNENEAMDPFPVCPAA